MVFGASDFSEATEMTQKNFSRSALIYLDKIFEIDQERFSVLAADLLAKYSGHSNVISLGCGSAEESIAIVNAGFNYIGLDESPVFATNNPLTLRFLLNQKHSIFKHDDLSIATEQMLQNFDETKLRLFIGEDYDCTNHELISLLPKDSIFLLRHPDIKDQNTAVNMMFDKIVSLARPIVITTSNTFSLYLLLDALKTSILNNFIIDKIETQTPIDNLPLFYTLDQFKERLTEVRSEVALRVPNEMLSGGNVFVESFNKLLAMSFETEDYVIKFFTEHTPGTTRSTQYRWLDSWRISVNFEPRVR